MDGRLIVGHRRERNRARAVRWRIWDSVEGPGDWIASIELHDATIELVVPHLDRIREGEDELCLAHAVHAEALI